MRDLPGLTLRVLLIVICIATVVFELFKPTPWAALFWAAIFVAVVLVAEMDRHVRNLRAEKDKLWKYDELPERDWQWPKNTTEANGDVEIYRVTEREQRERPAWLGGLGTILFGSELQLGRGVQIPGPTDRVEAWREETTGTTVVRIERSAA